MANRHWALTVAALTMLQCRTPAPATPSASLALELGDEPGELRVTNHGPSVSLLAEIAVEVATEASTLYVTNLTLRSECTGEPPPQCVQLATDATLHVKKWTGWMCNSQCPSSCRLDGVAEPGNYRFIVRTCDRTRAYRSPPFRIAVEWKTE